jgi:hypothetical protein
VTSVTGTRRINATWLIVSGLTIVSWALARTRSSGAATSSTAEALAVLAFGAIKARLIVQEFMEVRTAPRWLRRLTDAWLAGLFITVLVLYLS